MRQCYKCGKYKPGVVMVMGMKGGMRTTEVAPTDDNHGWCTEQGKKVRWNDRCERI